MVKSLQSLHTRQLGGTTETVAELTSAQLHALDKGYTVGLMWLAVVAAIAGAVALSIGYSARQVGHAREVRESAEAAEA